MTTSFSLRTLSRDDILEHLPELTDILVSCVNGGASVSFMLPFAPETATAFWLRMAQSVAAGERVVIAAADEQQRLVGTVQLIIDQPENQPHRADVAKLLVHQNARRLGLANALMAAGSDRARAGQERSGAGYGDRQRSREFLRAMRLGKGRGNSSLCADAGRRTDGDIAVL